MSRYEIRICGSGGQGIILAGIILAQAAVIEGKNVVQSQSYGPEARGGASRSDVIISDEEILYPKALNLDVLLCLTQEAANKYMNYLKEDGILIVDKDFVVNVPDRFKNVYRLSLVSTAKDKIGKAIFTNIVSLGALCKITGVVSFDSLRKAVEERVPAFTVKANLEALKVGYNLI